MEKDSIKKRLDVSRPRIAPDGTFRFRDGCSPNRAADTYASFRQIVLIIVSATGLQSSSHRTTRDNTIFVCHII